MGIMNFENLNNIQKIALSAFASLVLIMLFIHNPLSGYVTEQINPLHEQGISKVPCTQIEKDDFRQEMMSLEGGWTKKKGEPWTEEGRKREAAYINSSVEECTKSVSYKIVAPFTKWRSNEPMLNWFGPIVNIVQLAIIFGAIFGIVFFLFKENGKDRALR
tara:strand:- start:12941 stop:13423 length:483 start_codon:yes stop_codon:yes gene_type:complete